MNPFDKYFGPEDLLHIACCAYLDLQYPKLLYTHPANEGKRSKFEQYKAKKLRMKSGVPDLLIFDSGKWNNWNGFAIEFKTGNNTSSEKQIFWQKELNNNNWYYMVIRSVDEFIKEIDYHFDKNGITIIEK